MAALSSLSDILYPICLLSQRPYPICNQSPFSANYTLVYNLSMHPLKEGGVIDEGAAIKDVGAAPEVVYLLSGLV